jgi:hypothetical protein
MEKNSPAVQDVSLSISNLKMKRIYNPLDGCLSKQQTDCHAIARNDDRIKRLTTPNP